METKTSICFQFHYSTLEGMGGRQAPSLPPSRGQRHQGAAFERAGRTGRERAGGRRGLRPWGYTGKVRESIRRHTGQGTMLLLFGTWSSSKPPLFLALMSSERGDIVLTAGNTASGHSRPSWECPEAVECSLQSIRQTARRFHHEDASDMLPPRRYFRYAFRCCSTPEHMPASDICLTICQKNLTICQI